MERSRKTSVALVVNSLLVAGAETVVFEIASRIDRAKFDVAVYVLRDYGTEKPTLKSRFDEKGIRVLFVAKKGHIGIVAGIRALRHLFAQHRPDVVHCHLPDAVLAGSGAALVLRIPYIIHHHQSPRFHSWKIRVALYVLRCFARLTICFASSVEQEIAGSSRRARTYQEALARSTCTIPNGIDASRAFHARTATDKTRIRKELGCDDESLLITSIARFVEWKGHRLLIKSFAEAALTIPQARLCILGDGPLREELRAYAASLGIMDRVCMPGVRKDVYAVLASSDIFSLAFTYSPGEDVEAIGIAGFEAMACGLPVIIADYNGARDYVEHGKTGLVVEPRSSDSLSRAFIALAQDKDLRHRIGEAAAVYAAENLDWTALIKLYEDIYTHVI